MRYHLFLYVFTAIGSIWMIKKIVVWFKFNRNFKRKRKEVDQRKIGLFQKFKGMELPFKNIDKICSLSGKEILKKLKSGELSAVDILETYQANALIKNEELNFIADMIYDADVSSLMVDLDNSSEIIGFPLSISDSLSVAKYDCTLGLTTEINKPATKDSVIIKVLREQGAIPAIITNIGQADLCLETSNPIVGRTINFYNKKRTCGASAGGLAISLISQSSLIGIGSDINGNIRIPASFCGVFGLKPTSMRISTRHKKTIYPKQNIIAESIGPMARNIDDLTATFKSMLSERMYKLDPLCCPVPFNNNLFQSKKPLKLGYYIHIGGKEMTPIPAVERAVNEARAAMEKAGHELVEYQLPNTDEIVNKIYSQIIFSDGGDYLIELLKSGQIDSSLKSYIRFLKIPNLIKRFLGFMTSWFCNSGGSRITGSAGISSIYKLWQLKELVNQYREQVLTSWENKELDGIICPVLPIVAPPLHSWTSISSYSAYVIIYNILDYVAGTVPVTHVNQQDIDNLCKSYSLKSRCCRKIANAQKDSLGMPVGIQCVTLPWREEIALRMMKDITDNL